jgi:hypothetical protein
MNAKSSCFHSLLAGAKRKSPHLGEHGTAFFRFRRPAMSPEMGITFSTPSWRWIVQANLLDHRKKTAKEGASLKNWGLTGSYSSGLLLPPHGADSGSTDPAKQRRVAASSRTSSGFFPLSFLSWNFFLPTAS